MGVSINSNIAASTTLRYLDRSTGILRRSFERLSSGLRINRASDDAAGLSISEGLNFQARVGERGRLNVNDGVSAFQIAAGATEQISNLLVRMAELAEQSASGTLGSTQRRSLDKEYQALDKEIRRIAATTSFNGQKLLQGSAATTHRFTQISNTGAGSVNVGTAVISSDGRYVTYQNLDTNAVEQRDNETGVITTIASGTLSADIAASASAERVIYVASLAGKAEVFMWDRNNGQTTQITNSQGADFILDITISADGGTIAFAGLTDYADGGTRNNPLGYTPADWGVYTVDVASGVFHTAHTPTGGGVGFLNLSLSASGNYLSFTSNSNITGGNGNNNPEVYVRDLTNLTASGIRQITSTAGAEQPASFVTDSGQVYWLSQENLTGQNSVLASQVYHYSFQTGVTSQKTANAVAGVSIGNLALSPDGSRVTILTAVDLISNPSSLLSGVQAFQLDTATGSLQQMTNFSFNPAVTAVVAYSADGSTLLVASNSDLTGQNPDLGNELFTIDTSRDAHSLSISTGTGSLGRLGLLLDEIDGTLRGLGGHQLTTQSSALGALSATKLNINKLTSLQGAIGSSLSRLDYAANVISTSALEAKTARSRIIDADIAEEAAILTRGQILQQAGSAVLAQANLQPSVALRLLSLN